MSAPVAWLGVAALTAVPTIVHAQACDPTDSNDNDNDADDSCMASTVGKNQGNPKKPGCDCTYPQGSSGDPIDNATGNIYVEEDDLQGGGAFPLRLTRSYNSSTISMLYMSGMTASMGTQIRKAHPAGHDGVLPSEDEPRSEIENSVYPIADTTSTSGIATYVYPFSAGWSFNLGARLLLDNVQPVTSLEALRSDGQVLSFTFANGAWSTDADINDHLTEQTNGAGAITGWTLVDDDLNTESYDATGHLLSLANRAGMVQNFIYSSASTPSSVAPAAGLLITATDPSGRTLQFTYNAQSLVSTVTDSTGGQYVYQYNSNGYLGSVTYPDKSVRQYNYEYSGISTYYLLTGVVDETNTTYANYTYNTSYQAGTSSSLAGNVNSITLTQGNSTTTTNASQTTDALGAVRSYNSQFLVNGFRNNQVQTPCLGCATSVNTTTYTYNPNGYVATETHVLGDDSTPRNLAYTWDTAHNLLLTFVDGSGSPQQRTTTTSWNTALRVPLTRTVANASNALVTSEQWFYNANGQALAYCVVDPTNSAASGYSCSNTGTVPSGVRRWTHTYCTTVTTGCPIIGLMLTSTGPRTDLTQTTTYSYYTTSSATNCGTPGAPCYQKGDLYQVTDALGHVTTIASYDGEGRITRINDANGVNTDLTYTPRGWLHTRSVGGATTTVGYTSYGAISSITDPDNIATTYGYDSAHRLTDIFDAQGNDLHYTLDNAGDKTGEKIISGSTTLQSATWNYNSLGQLTSLVDGLNQTVFNAGYSDSYDGNGDQTHTADGRGFQRHLGYDALNRLTTTVENYNGTDTATNNTTTTTQYDSLDRPTSVTDPRTYVTNYTYDGLSDLTALQSPDSGSSSGTFDAAGNTQTHTDAKGTVATSTYDALDRVTATTYPSTVNNVAYYYDQANATTGCTASSPIGRLTQMVENAVTTTYCYDVRGNIVQKKQTVSGTLDTTSYGYTSGDRLQSENTPDHTLVSYSFDTNGRIQTVQVTPSGSTSAPPTVVSSITWMPFGPIKSYTLGNGQVITRSYDANYRLTDLTTPTTFNLHFALDAMGDITGKGAAQGANPAGETYQYDPLYRLLSVTDSGTVFESYTYNRVGDRLSKTTSGAASGTYTYTPNTHQLVSTGTNTRANDQNGNTTGSVVGGNTFGFAYNGRQRIVLAQRNSATVGTYIYNALGQRVSKSVTYPSTVATRFAYDEAGQIIGNYNVASSGNGNKDTVWVGDIPVAEITDVITGSTTTSTVNYVIADQLGTPRQVTDATGTIIWSWTYAGNPFGEAQPYSSTGYTLNLRYPGQWYDAETGANNNGMRTYDPTVGRYLQTDPIGLRGGISTFAYVSSNPLMSTDSQGLCSCTLKPGAYSSNPKKHNFITPDRVSAANGVATQLGTTTADVLASAAIESGWGTSNFAVNANNFFGLHAPQAGQSGVFVGKKGVKMSSFSNFGASLQSFANNYGNLVQGVTDPAAFFSALQNSGAFGIDPATGGKVPDYVSSSVGTEKGIASNLICVP